MQRGLRSALRFSQQLSACRRFASTSRNFHINQTNRSKWIASGLVTVGATGFLLSSPILADVKAKESLKLKPEATEKKESSSEPKKEVSGEKEQEKETPAEESGDDHDQQGAYNPETGEINWDCPCLGGMAHGPCGEEFKEAFSCFIYSELDPKGIDCVEKFKNMQNCFRKYPDVYSEELRDDEEDVVVQDTVVEDDKGNVVAEEITITEVTPEVVEETTIEVSADESK